MYTLPTENLPHFPYHHEHRDRRHACESHQRHRYAFAFVWPLFLFWWFGWRGWARSRRGRTSWNKSLQADPSVWTENEDYRILSSTSSSSCSLSATIWVGEWTRRRQQPQHHRSVVVSPGVSCTHKFRGKTTTTTLAHSKLVWGVSRVRYSRWWWWWCCWCRTGWLLVGVVRGYTTTKLEQPNSRTHQPIHCSSVHSRRPRPRWWCWLLF